MRTVARWLGFGALGGVVLLAVGVSGLILAPEPDYSDTPMPEVRAVTDPAVIERGRYVVHAVAHCAHCHGDPESEITRHQASPPQDLAGGSPIDGGPMGSFYPVNLTSDATGLAGLTDGQIARAIRTGVLHDGRLGLVMLNSLGDLSDADLVAVISYLRALPPVRRDVPRPTFGALGRTMARLFSPREAVAVPDVPPGPPSVERGRYLAEHAANCAPCHTPHDPISHAFTGPRFSGGEPFPDRSDGDWEFAPPNLTPDPETGRTGAWDEDQFVARFRAGRAYPDSPMPWEAFGQLTDDDLRSVYRYLRTVPPVRRDTGAARREAGS